ncbi:MAG: abortive infection family protein [Planctomycetes bacterium]|nr:abortive infection family protein [Planctomycetota bacterium]
MKIPPSLIGLVGRIISEEHTHAEIDSIFLSAGFPEDVPAGSRPTKVQQWMRDANREFETPLENLGNAIAEYMDRPEPDADELDADEFARARAENYTRNRNKIEQALLAAGLTYFPGGRIVRGGVSGASRTLEQRLRQRPIQTIQEEFDRALENVDASPRQALDAACAILESVCKYYLSQNEQALPSNQSLKPLWTATARHIGLHPEQVEDDDFKKILSGMFSAVDGIASIRTHAGGAHGRLEPSPGERRYTIKGRHARLAIHSAHTLTLFLLETWEDRESSTSAG